MENMMQDRIDSYIRGEMTAAERSMFTSELSTNPELRKEFELTRRIANSISDRAKRKNRFRHGRKKTLLTRQYICPQLLQV